MLKICKKRCNVPQKCLCADEQIFPYYSNHSCKQYISKKPKKWGYKNFFSPTTEESFTTSKYIVTESILWKVFQMWCNWLNCSEIGQHCASLKRYASIFCMLALLLRLLLVHTARLTPKKRLYFQIINHNIKYSNDDFET